MSITAEGAKVPLYLRGKNEQTHHHTLLAYHLKEITLNHFCV